jgi:hypothetical protein
MLTITADFMALPDVRIFWKSDLPVSVASAVGT